MSKIVKTVLVTGGNRGIGYETAHQLSQSGHKVILTARDSAKGEVASASLGESVVFFPMDVTSDYSVKMCVSAVTKYLEEQGAKLDGLVNNAGCLFDDVSGSADPNDDPLYSDIETLTETLEVNTIGAYRVTKAFLPLLGRDRRADIINVSSDMGSFRGMGTGAPAYRLSKAAMNALSVYLGASLAGTKIRSNSVCPGWVNTQLGGPSAPRTPEQGVQGILWIIDHEPDINGVVVKDREIIGF